MILKRHLSAVGLCLCLLSGPALAERDFTDYYTYYKVKSGDTLESIAAEHEVHIGAIEAMNRGRDLRAELSPGSFVCVPKPEAVEAEEPATPVKKKATRVRDEEVDEPEESPPRFDDVTEEELAYITSVATKGSRRLAPAYSAPRSRFIGADGRVTYIPSAKPKVKPQKDVPRRSLSSRQGRKIHKIVSMCRRYIGVPYVWGGESPGGFDCSGYVQYVFHKNGIRLPRTADIQYEVGQRVKTGQERPGDMVFFETYAPGASHVGVYLGNRFFIHASSSRGVTISSLDEEFFSARYLGARRKLR